MLVANSLWSVGRSVLNQLNLAKTPLWVRALGSPTNQRSSRTTFFIAAAVIRCARCVLMCPWKRVNSNSTNAVYRDAEHFGTESLKFGQEFVVERHLIVTHRALISRVKRENYRPPRKSCKETR